MSSIQEKGRKFRSEERWREEKDGWQIKISEKRTSERHSRFLHESWI